MHCPKNAAMKPGIKNLHYTAEANALKLNFLSSTTATAVNLKVNKVCRQLQSLFFNTSC
jgi:hypothetical protein